MGKIVLIYVLFLVVASVTLDMVNKEKASRLLLDISIICSSLIVVLIMFIAFTVIITSTKEVLLIRAYKLQDLCTTYRQMLCATSKLKLVNMLLLIYVQVLENLEWKKYAQIMSFESMSVLHSSNIIYCVCHISNIFYVPKSYYYHKVLKLNSL